MRKELKILSGLFFALAILIIPIACSMQNASSSSTTGKTGAQNADAFFAAASAVSIEAESMSKSGYSNESNTGASGGIVAKLSGTSGSITKNFSGVTASYDIAVTYIDQASGTSTFTLAIAGTAIATWSGDQATTADLFATKTFLNITVANGAQIKLSGTKNGSELAKYDVIKFNPAGTASSLSSTSTTSSFSAPATSVSSSKSSTSSSSATTSSSSSSSSKSSSSSSSSSVSSNNTGVYYVSPNGSDSNTGTIDKPFLTLTKADSVAAAGVTIYLRGGTYAYSATVNLKSSGTSGNLIKMWAYPGEYPVIDFSGESYSDSSRGLYLKGSYWHLKGIEEKNAGDNGLIISGNYNIIEQCVVHGNKDAGLQIGSGGSYNQIINCDSYDNSDPGSNPPGGNADGFACKLTNGPGNSFYGCRSWSNSDDGWDLYGNVYDVKIENCWTFNNGLLQGNGNGFKVGGNNTVGTVYVANCMTFGNIAKGFDQNHNAGPVTLYNNTSWKNGKYNYSFYEVPTSGQIIMKNNISFEPGVNDQGPQGTWLSTSVVQSNNSWQGFTVTSADFSSLDTSFATAARKADGSLPDVPFLHLAAGSSMINAGANVGLPYNGSAPDLGAFETK